MTRPNKIRNLDLRHFDDRSKRGEGKIITNIRVTSYFGLIDNQRFGIRTWGEIEILRTKILFTQKTKQNRITGSVICHLYEGVLHSTTLTNSRKAFHSGTY